MKNRILFLLVIFYITMPVKAANEIFQNVRGQVVDKLTQAPLAGASVFIPDASPVVGTLSDENGYFLLSHVPVGRVTITAAYMGYKPMTFSNIAINSGKELILKFDLEETVIMGQEIVVKGEKSGKAGTGNTMAAVSSRYFTIEESMRYAGARNDISRMAANYAGVSTPNDANNDIVIRGNSPTGLLWRLDGTEIPNPNHFGFLGSTGGPVSMLNNNVLMNSVFMTAAFPAEYTDAFSGVFDLKMRNGNSEKHEFLGQVGFNGFEGGAEGPLPIGKHSSYLVNYRYSTLGLLHDIGADFGTGVAVPNYQDLTFKVNIPTTNMGKFSLTGLGGINSINFNNSSIDSADLTQDLYTQNQDLISKNSLGAVILNHTYPINDHGFTHLTLSANTIYNQALIDSLSVADRSPVPYVRNYSRESAYTARFSVSQRLSTQHFIKLGASYKIMEDNFLDSVLYAPINGFINVLDEKGSTGQLSAFAQWQYKITDNLTLNTGLSYQMLTLNKSASLEPRASMSWNLDESSKLSFGYGLHSKTYPIQVYVFRKRIGDELYIQPNKNLDLQKSHHFVLGYDRNLGKNWRVKTEAYYQYIFNVAVQNRPSSFSMINYSSITSSIPDTLADGGIATNKGVELTLERFLSDGYYFLMTGSLYDSKYRGSDKKWYSTAFDGGYVLNVLSGKDFKISKSTSSKTKWLATDLKMTWAGGQRYTPINRELSLQNKRTETYDNQAFTKSYDNYLRIDLRIAYRIDGKRISQESGIELSNLTNHKNPYYSYYNPMIGDLQTVYQIGFYPMMQYRIVF
jgi:hypothetical protein